jgi:sugar lactone lactonase YvrE
VALAVDHSGTIYAANDSDHQIEIFPPGSNGNVTPQVLGGSNVPLKATEGIAIDSTGQIYTSDYRNNAIFVFPPGTTGNTPPSRTITGANTLLNGPIGMAFDGAGNLLVANFYASTENVLKFSPTANGNVAPIAYIGGSNTKLGAPFNVNVDHKGRIIVADNTATAVLIFKPGAHGNATPVATISGSHTSLTNITSTGVDPQGRIYATNVGASPSFVASVLVFLPTANGDVAPVRTISGPNTTMKDVFNPSFH